MLYVTKTYFEEVGFCFEGEHTRGPALGFPAQLPCLKAYTRQTKSLQKKNNNTLHALEEFESAKESIVFFWPLILIHS